MHKISPVAEEALTVLTNFTMTGGKRIRPTFAWLGWVGAKQLTFEESVVHPDAHAVMHAVSSLELLQSCALIHDDIIDSSATRRGMPTVHEQFKLLHSAQAWHGHGESYGHSVAILIGDLALSWADDMFVEAGLSADQRDRAWLPWREMRTEVVCGQIMDVTAEAQADGSLLTADRVNRYKTAAYTVERPLHIGAALAGASEKTVTALRTFGRDLGVAFQLRDDELGVFGDPEVTGKPSGDDLREGKRTTLLALALENTSESDRAELESGLGRPLTEVEVDRLRGIIRKSGAYEQVQARIDDLVSSAVGSLAHADLSEDAKRALTTMAKTSTERRR
ncbi:polyprenyl synthetase family protein [Corynebacterium sp. PCR 32]|uniref:polyprenyl synthetase family protein n=1 Tax=Corynebacterium sp. PCR 32 TaxID=3351342 RepID=UPI003752D13A